MSFKVPQQPPPADDVSDIDDSDSSESTSEEETWDDWVSDSATRVATKSLFDDQVFASVTEALEHDKEAHGFALEEVCKKLSLDFHARVRLINYIRKEKPAASTIAQVQGSEPWLSSDDYLIPTIENDPLLQTGTDDWSDSDSEDVDPSDLPRKIKRLEKKLQTAQQSLSDYRDLMAQKLEISNDLKGISASEPVPKRDDDTHYFDSYAENDIHAIMIQDKVRTSTYARFILGNSILFTDAVVLDVGCGTGILSLFAAKAGAKRVFSVDASKIAEKAEKIVEANGLSDVITVVRGKVEDIQLPEDVKVDIIISEWMGYALLYESMLDSVLVARDRFLKPDGVMAPSDCRMMFSLCDATEIYKDRIGFWDDVYGFDLTAMTEGLYDESVVDVLGPSTLLSKPVCVKDLFIREITIGDLDFSNPFKLVSTSEKRIKVRAFVLYFDTFFTSTGDRVPPGTEVTITRAEDSMLAEVWPVGGKPAHKRRQSVGQKDRVTSFSTGPASEPTHWKQTLFILKEPFSVSRGSVVSGQFTCKKSKVNSRELDVEISYTVQEDDDSTPGRKMVQKFKVR